MKISKKLTVILAVIGTAFIALSFIKIPGEEEDTVESYTNELQKSIENTVEEITGEDCTVLITLECSEESVYAENKDIKETERITDIVIVSGKNEPVRLKEIYPKIRGVGIVCKGGDNVKMQNKISKLLSSALGISVNKITVCDKS